jgi:1,4-alpha-glucan branching enzyme
MSVTGTTPQDPPTPTFVSLEEKFSAFREGVECRLDEILGAHPCRENNIDGARFAVWAPNAENVAVMGDCNGWDKDACPLQRVGATGVWSGFVPEAGVGERYKFFVTSHGGKFRVDKSDPVAFWNEEPPRTASVVWKLDYHWNDQHWLAERECRQNKSAPISIYELHPGSWRRIPEESNRWMTYRELAMKLAEYLPQMGFTHVELLPVMEHPFYASWGYQSTGFFAPTSRYGTPQDFMWFVDHLHQHGIGVLLDWVPFHFPNDNFALSYFDGGHIYAHPDPRRGFHPSWRSAVFDYTRPEVRSFLLSSALFWLRKYHIDGLRVDAVSYMLFHNYYRRPGEWIPNEHGGAENLQAASFLRQLNDAAHTQHPGAIMVAEEATTWPGITRATRDGGLGFDYKWDMGWMNDTLQFMKRDAYHRKRDLNKITFRMMYAFSEKFVLALSHDEVVHLKGSLWTKMWQGNQWEKFAGLRLLYGYMYGQPGKKLLFMGAEMAQQREWNHDNSLDWHLLHHAPHAGIQRCLTDLNRHYREQAPLHELDLDPSGFEWIACDDTANGVVSFLRKARTTSDLVLVVCNFSAFACRNYRVGVPRAGMWKEIFNSDARDYGGGGIGNCGGFPAETKTWNGRPFSMNLTLPPLSAIYFFNKEEPVVAEEIPDAPEEEISNV